MLTSIIHQEGDPLQALFMSCPTLIPLSCSQEATLSTFDWGDFPVVSTEECDFPVHIYDQQRSQTQTQVPTGISFFERRPALPQTTIATTTRRFHPTADDDTECFQSNPIPSKPLQVVSVCAPSKNSSSRQRNVHFSDIISVRCHNLILGDHPCCSGGLAMESSWDYEEEFVNFDVFEQASLKRRSSQLRLSYIQRRNRLMEATGFTGAELLRQEYQMMTAASVDPSGIICPLLHKSSTAPSDLMECALS